MSETKVNELKTTLENEFSGDEYQPLEAGEGSTFNLANMIDTSRRFSASCPVIPDIQFTWIDGSSVSIPVSSVFEMLCPYLAWFGYILVAFAMRHAAEIVAGGFR